MKRKTKIAVCVHIYYEEMWDYIVNYISNIKLEADFFITFRAEIQNTISKNAARDLPSATLVPMPNLGMDVLPFLLLCHEKQLYNYDAVLKLHTKNQKTKLRADQGRIMLDGLCGSASLVNEIADVFRRDPDAGMVGTAFQVRSASALMYGNRKRMNELLASLEIHATDWPFFTGTMFWIAGRLLKTIADMAPQLLEEARQETASKTGGDGALAHTLERVFGALSTSMAANIYLTEKQGPTGDAFLVIPMREHGPANSWRLMELGSADLVRRYSEAKSWCDIITKKAGYFDPTYYRNGSAQYSIPGMNDAYHFVLYGDLFEVSPSEKFNTTYYLLRRGDVVRDCVCSLVHYIQFGHRENCAAQPTESDWQALCERYTLFDPDWYQKTYADVDLVGMTPAQHYWQIGQYLNRAGSPKFRPERIPVLARARSEEKNSPIYFLKNHFFEEKLLHDVLKRAIQNGDYVLVPDVARRIISKFGTTRALNEALATSATLNYRWDLAQDRWSEFWAEVERGENTGRHGQTLIQFDRPPPRPEGFEITEPGAMTHMKRVTSSDRICIYTTLFGEIDQLAPVLNPIHGVDYICFTDRPREAAGWRQVSVDPQQSSNNLNAKIFKVLPHKYLQNYDYSMFVDANTVFLGRTAELINLCRAGGDFIMWQHPLRDDAYTEVCAVIGHFRHGPDKLIAQLKHYAEQGFPRHTPMFEASFI